MGTGKGLSQQQDLVGSGETSTKIADRQGMLKGKKPATKKKEKRKKVLQDITFEKGCKPGNTVVESSPSFAL